MFETMFSCFIKGGPVMYPLLICSVVTLAVAIERYVCFRGTTSNLPQLFHNLESYLKTADWEQAAEICYQNSGEAAQIMAQGLDLAGVSPQAASQAMEGAAALLTARLRERLGYLDTIVTLAPLFGLLGTVVGMIETFNIFALRAGQPMAITGGVGEALIATAFGLCVAAVALLVHSLFTQRLERLITDVEEAANHVLLYLLREHKI